MLEVASFIRENQKKLKIREIYWYKQQRVVAFDLIAVYYIK